MKNIFISYSSLDRPDALELWHILKNEALNVWLDAFDINPSENLEEELFKNIKKADVLCLLLSPSSVTSKWVRKEIEQALIQRHQRGLKILAIILRPCEIPDQIKGITALRAYETYEGLKNEYIRLQLTKAIVGQHKVSDTEIDEALQKSLGDLAKQKEAAGILPQLATELDRLRNMSIRDVEVKLNPTVFLQPIFKEDPIILELRLVLNPLFNNPMSFYFAKFKEGSTWPPEFGFEEPPYTEFALNMPRIDAKLGWYDYVQDFSRTIDGTELGLGEAAFTIQFDGSEYQPASGNDRFHVNIPGLRQNLEIPALQKLIDDKCEFKLITHCTYSKTAKEVDLKKTDIDLELVARFRIDDTWCHCTLFKSRHSQLENIILSGDYLSNIKNPIEREAILGLYPHDNKTKLANEKKRWEVHNMLLMEPAEIDWVQDRRFLARLIDNRVDLADSRKRTIHLFNWEDVPGQGNIKIKDFLKEDFRYHEHFAYLIYDSEDEVEEAKISKSDDYIDINITSKKNIMLTLRAIPELDIVKVLVDRGDAKQAVLFHFLLSNKYTKSMKVWLSDEYNAIQDNIRMIELLRPLIIQHQATYNDVYLVFKAYNRVAYPLIRNKNFEEAARSINQFLLLIQRMIESNLDEPSYIRWKARALRLLAEAELGQNKIIAATQHLINSTEEFERLYTTIPNRARIEDYMASLEYGLKFEGISHRGSLPIKKWRNNLSKLIEKKNSVDNFITRSSIKLDNLATGEQLVNSLEILYGKGSTSRSKNTSYIQLVPKKGFDYNTWEHVNKILKANGFEWMTILEDESQSGHPNKFWEKWVEQIPEQDKI
jgi:hypothetical protein